MDRPRALLLAAAVLTVSCAGSTRRFPAAPPGQPEATAPDGATGAADAGLAALPFRLPCGDEDVAGCTTGCADKQTEDCVTLASMYLAGTLVPPDRAQAIAMFRTACAENSARGCIRLADACHAGLVPEGDDSVTYYRQACDAGANLGCVAAAKAYLAGDGVPRDPVFAATLLGRVCNRGNAAACMELGRLNQRGNGVPVNAERALELFDKACKLGLDEGCLAASSTGEALSPRE